MQTEKMQKEDKKRYVRLIYKKTFAHLGTTLVIALVVGALLGGGIYTVNAFCALGFVMICWGWFTYLKMTGMRPFGKNPNKKKAKVPYFHKKDKGQKPHRPSFRMDSEDFDDDLTSSTHASDEEFTKKQADAARAIARAVCGAILVIASFFIPMS